MNNCTKAIIDKGQNIVKVLVVLKKRMDMRAKTCLLNLFTPDNTPGDISLLDVLFLLIGTPRTASDIKTLKIDEEIKREISQWLQWVLATELEVKQELKLSYIQAFLQEASILNDTISNKSDKRKSELIQNVIEELNWNIALLQNA